MARLREEIGDPQAALVRFITERFEPEALIPGDRREGNPLWDAWEDDDDLPAW